MTAELRVSLPEDVADWLKQQEDAAAAIAQAVRAQIRAARVDEVLRAAGLEPMESVERQRRPAEPVSLLAEGRRTLANRTPGGL